MQILSGICQESPWKNQRASKVREAEWRSCHQRDSASLQRSLYQGMSHRSWNIVYLKYTLTMLLRYHSDSNVYSRLYVTHLHSEKHDNDAKQMVCANIKSSTNQNSGSAFHFFAHLSVCTIAAFLSICSTEYSVRSDPYQFVPCQHVLIPLVTFCAQVKHLLFTSWWYWCGLLMVIKWMVFFPQLAAMMFRQTVFDTRRRPKSMLRSKTKSSLKDTPSVITLILCIYTFIDILTVISLNVYTLKNGYSLTFFNLLYLNAGSEVPLV